ncbi:MAG: FecR family protein [Nitritalea sp.]
MENQLLAEKKYKALLVRRLAAESLTTAEEEALASLAAELDGEGAIAEAFALAWHCAEATDSSLALARIQQRVLAQVHVSEPSAPKAAQADFSSMWTDRLARSIWPKAIAAVLLGALLVLSFLFYPAEPIDQSASLSIFTAEGGRRFLQLEDGTRVTLAPGASLSYASGYGTVHREVQVEGQFFFHVAKDEALPFLIVGEATTTRVTGTSFNLLSVAGHFQVEVATGSVQIIDANQPRSSAVAAGERLRVMDSVWSQEEIGAEQPFLWTEREWSFEAVPLAEVFQAMERAKGIKIQVADSALLGCRFTGKIGAESGTEVLRMIAQVMQLELTEIHQHTFLFRGRPC